LPVGNDRSTEKQLENWLKKIIQNNEYSSIAWVFPKKTRRIEFEGNFYPGVVLLTKKI